MSAQQSGRPANEDGLDRAAVQAPTAVMRAIAQVAIDRKLTFLTLAELLNRQDQTCLEASNVRRHFDSKHPRETTVAAYARALGITVEDLNVIGGLSELSESRVVEEIKILRQDLLVHAPFLESADIEGALDFLSRADPESLARIAKQFFYSSQRPPKFPGSRVLDALDGVRAIRIRRRTPNESLLRALWQEAKTVLDDEGADAVVAAAVREMMRKGVDPRPYEERFAIEQSAFARFFEEGR